jgi:hypothetical protein
VLLERPHDLGDGGPLLADGHVDALHLLLRIAARPVLALVDDRVDGHGGLAGLLVADDQLPLSPADRSHAVDGLDPGLQGFLHGLALHDRRRLDLQVPDLLGVDRALAVNGSSQRVHDPPEERVPDGHGEDAAGLLDGVALLDLGGLAEHDHPDAVDVEVQGDAEHVVLELEELVRHGVREPLHERHPVPGGDDAADLLALHRRPVVLDVLAERFGDLFGGDDELLGQPGSPLRRCDRSGRPTTGPG